MIAKEYRVRCEKGKENPFNNEIVKFIHKNRLNAECKPLYFENDDTLRVVVFTTQEVHKRLEKEGFRPV